ncbi:MAG: DUF4190 domain-containing protein [Oscillospiraceae bacterium]
MDEFNSQNNDFEQNSGSSVDLSKENNSQNYSQGVQGAPQDNSQSYQQNQNPQDSTGRVAYGQPGYNGQNSGYNPSQSGYTEPQTGYNNNTVNGSGYYNPNGYNQNGYNQNNYDMNNPNNYQYNQYGGYQDPYFQRQPSQGMAIGSLVCGIVGLSAGILGWVFPLLFFVPLVGLILGIVFKVKYPGYAKGISTAGIVLNSIGIALPFIFIIVAVASLPQLMEWMQQVDPEAYEELYEEYADELPGMFSAAFAAVRSLFIK